MESSRFPVYLSKIFHNYLFMPQEDTTNAVSVQSAEIKKPYVPTEEHIIGGIDTAGYKIKNIYAISSRFVVYEVEGVHLADSCRVLILPSDDSSHSNNYSAIQPKLAEIKSVLYKCHGDELIRGRIGFAIALAIRSGPEAAIALLDALLLDINSQYTENFIKRIAYLGGAFGVLCLFGVVSVAIRLASFKGLIGPKAETLELLLFVITSGVIGGFISVSYKLKSIAFERGVTWHYFLIYGIERLVISVLASLVLLFSIKANIIFGFVKDAPSPFYGYMFFGVLAGFSETLIPDLLIKMEKQGLQAGK
jgi:hypothetical protein